jgi:hypothetical protein
MNAEPQARNGRNIPAQGAALGRMPEKNQALKGRATGTGIVPPFQGFCHFGRFPRALPWAGMSRPVGPESGRWHMVTKQNIRETRP